MNKFLMIGSCLLALFPAGLRSEKLAVFSELDQPQRLVMDDQRIFITQQHEVFVYSRTTGRLEKRFGRRGEGPGEFRIASGGIANLEINVQSDKIIITSLNRVGFFSKSGRHVMDVNRVKVNLLTPLESGFAGYRNIQEHNLRLSCFFLLNGDLQPVRRFYQKRSILERKKDHVLWFLFSKSFPGMVVCRDKIFVLGPVTGFLIKVFTHDGTNLKTIVRDDPPVRFNERHRQMVLDYYRQNPVTRPEYDVWKRIIRFPKHFPAVRSIHTDGRCVCLRTYSEKEHSSAFFLYDCQGKFIKKVFLPIRKSNVKLSYPFMRDSAPFAFRDGFLYQLEENSVTEAYELHRYRL